jgi:hypothetical protein
MPTNKPRLSINLPEEEYAALATITDRNRLSMAWVGRQAIIEVLDRCCNKHAPPPLKIGSLPERTRK